MNVAIIADWLVTYGGAEHVLAQVHTLYPNAPLFTTVAEKNALGPLSTADIRTTRLQKWYKLLGNHQVLLPFMPRAVEEIDLQGFDLIISSSHAVAKGIIPPPGALHMCYCHTPVRYAWEMEEDYLRDFKVPAVLKKRVKRELSKLRRWDLSSAQRVDVFIANSTTTQERIKRIYGRESVVISPPVEERFFSTVGTPHGGVSMKNYFLAVGRLVPYKRFDLLIEVANELKLPLKIAGRGQDEARLKKLAGPTVEFLGFVPETQLPALYANAQALLFPQYEDAGIVPLEAQATGTPVIAYKAGGAIDSVIEHQTGIFFAEQTVASVREALEKFGKVEWNREMIRNHAKRFSQSMFREKITGVIRDSYEDFKNSRFRRS